MEQLVRVIGCGNPEAGDDALGLLAVERARPALAALPGVDVVAAGPAHRVLDLLDGTRAAIIVDAVRTPGGEREAGTLVRVQVGEREIPVEVEQALSSHGFSLGDTLGLAATLGRTPRLVFLGLEVGDIEIGKPLSNEVYSALPGLVGVLENEVARLINVHS